MALDFELKLLRRRQVPVPSRCGATLSRVTADVTARVTVLLVVVTDLLVLVVTKVLIVLTHTVTVTVSGTP